MGKRGDNLSTGGKWGIGVGVGSLITGGLSLWVSISWTTVAKKRIY